MTANDDDKSDITKNHVLPVKVCEKSDLAKFADKMYTDKYWDEIRKAKGLALCPDLGHKKYDEAGWKNHLGNDRFNYIETTV